MPDLRFYLPLGGRVVLAARLLFGQMWVQGDVATPITQRFYLGGPNSHRGFNFNRLSAQVCSRRLIGAPIETAMEAPDCSTVGIMENEELQRLPLGGDQMLLLQAEARIYLLRLWDNWLSAAAFFDAGDVAAPTCVRDACVMPPYLQQIDLARLHLAAGGGLRYQTVIGTIRVDVAGRLNRRDEFEIVTRADGTEERIQNPDPGDWGAFHISIGEAF
jgi:outer membrane protein assembly factor BamA